LSLPPSIPGGASFPPRFLSPSFDAQNRSSCLDVVQAPFSRILFLSLQRAPSSRPPRTPDYETISNESLNQSMSPWGPKCSALPLPFLQSLLLTWSENANPIYHVLFPNPTPLVLACLRPEPANLQQSPYPLAVIHFFPSAALRLLPSRYFYPCSFEVE